MTTLAEILVVVFGALTALIGVWGILIPRRLQGWILNFTPRVRLSLAVVIRVVFGVALLAAASTSKAPVVLQIFGVLALLAAAVLAIFGAERLETWAQWWSRRSSLVIRTWSGAAFLLGAFLVFAVL